MANQDDFEVNSQNFLSWLSKMGITVSPKMQLADLRSESRGRGAIAVGDFEEDEVIFSIPRQSVLNLKTASVASANGAPNLDVFSLPPWLALTAIILSESRQPDSKWSPYFSILPNKLDSLVFWSDAELAELQASTVVHKIGKAGAEEMFAKHLEPLGFDAEICHRVASTIMAYAFDIPEDVEKKAGKPTAEGEAEDDLESDDEEDEKTILSMVPLADMLNADVDRNNARLFYDNAELEMRAIKPISAGDEIFNDYGQLPRADLLRRYGYATDNYAPFDVAELSTDAILAAFADPSSTILPSINPSLAPLTASQLKRRVEIAEREGAFEDSFDVYVPSPDQPALSDELLAFTFILLADRETFDAIHSSHIAIPSRAKLATQLVGRVLCAFLKAREAEYASSLEDDEALLLRGELSYRARLAVQVRAGEKRILRAAVAEAESFSGSDKRMRIAQEEEVVERSNGKRKGEQQQNTTARKRGRK